MNKPGTQELLPPLSASTNDRGSVLDWLTSPVAGQIMLPLTGLWILGLDWLLFSEDAATLGMATPFTVVLGFLLGTAGTLHFQRRYAGDTGIRAWLKALLAGVIVGVPFPLAGTVVGAWILTKSGLMSWKNRILSRFAK